MNWFRSKTPPKRINGQAGQRTQGNSEENFHFADSIRSQQKY